MGFRDDDHGLAERADALQRRVDKLQLELVETKERLAISEERRGKLIAELDVVRRQRDRRFAPVHPAWRWVALVVALMFLGLAAHAAGR